MVFSSIPILFRQLANAASPAAAKWGAAAGVCTGFATVNAAIVLTSCISPEPTVRVATAPAPSAVERYCAWYGDARDGTLYFGQAPFWSALQASGGRPTGDLDREGPALIGRFDLANERLLPPLNVSAGGDRSGVWDVLAHRNGRIYFTSYFEHAGYIDPDRGVTRRFEALGLGLNELAEGPGGGLLATRYRRQGHSGGSGGGGSVVLFGVEGTPLAEYRLGAPPGWVALPKTVAFDPLRREIWVTSDGLRESDLATQSRGPIDLRRSRHDTYVLDSQGREKRRIAVPEIQFVVFAENGTGYRAEVEGRLLTLRIVPPAPEPERIVRLDDRFPGHLDFVQDIQPMPDGRTVVTRWSGWIHVVGPDLGVRSLRLPSIESGGLYYTAVLSDHRICATYCADVTVVCRDLH